MPAICTSLARSDFGSDGHGNFEAVVRVGDDLWHVWRDNSTDKREWKQGRRVCQGGVAGAGSIIQSTLGDGEHGNFEVVVPLEVGGGQVRLFHFVHFNDNVDSDWVASPHVVTEPNDEVMWPASIIQSDFGDSDDGNFEVVVPLRGPEGSAELWHFFHDNSRVDSDWVKSRRITEPGMAVAGPASIIQSSYGGDHGNFEVVVPIFDRMGRPELWHYFHDNSSVDNEWVGARRVTGPSDWVAGGGIILESDFGEDDHGNFEVVVPLRMADGHVELQHFWHKTDVHTLWQRGQMVTASASGWASMIRSDYGPEEHRNFEVLVEECHRSIVHYWHNNERVDEPWLRGGPLVVPPLLTGEEPIARLGGTRKIRQLTGEFDMEGWAGPGTPDPPLTQNQTLTRAQIRGTDLGVSFHHRDHTYFLFGDTWREPQDDRQINLDSIAYTSDDRPDDGLSLTFLREPPIIDEGAIPQREFEVPLDGVSFRDSMFVFFSTDHFKVAHADQMGRSIVARCDQLKPRDFSYLWELSRRHFVNVSVDVTDRDIPGLPSFEPTLLMWGSGRYRSSDVYLAAMPLEEIASGRFIRYYMGESDRTPTWDDDERSAVPLFCAGCVGELSVRWNPFVERWITLYNSDNPRGIVMRSAHNPWGPWSGPVIAFDPADGYGRFMHRSWADGGTDHNFDNMFGEDRRDVWGGEYGAYQIAPLARGEHGSTSEIYFTMSTWNPYQVMLMRTSIALGGPELPNEG